MLSKSPVKWVERIAAAVRPSDATMLMLGNYLKTQIVERTARGVDADNRPFAPYSEKFPVYWAPYTGSKRAHEKARTATDQMIKKLGGSTKTGVIRDVNGKAVGHRHGDTTIKFRSYGAFKRALGRGGVDLTGPRAPHMMQALTVRVVPDGVTIGIYGEAAARAHGHQHGNPKKGLPQRKFLGATDDDRKHMLKLLSAAVRSRIKSVTRP